MMNDTGNMRELYIRTEQGYILVTVFSIGRSHVSVFHDSEILPIYSEFESDDRIGSMIADLILQGYTIQVRE